MQGSFDLYIRFDLGSRRDGGHSRLRGFGRGRRGGGSWLVLLVWASKTKQAVSINLRAVITIINNSGDTSRNYECQQKCMIYQTCTW